MKKRILIFVFIVVIIIIIGMGIIYIFPTRANLEFANEGVAVFVYNGVNIQHKLTVNELSYVKRIFNNNWLYRDNPSCGFSENVAIVLNSSQTLCLACDGCPVVFWKEKNRYIKLSEEELTQLYDLLEAYGFSFPCL